MKLILVCLITALIALTDAFAYGDYRARYCELFVYDLVTSTGPFGARILEFHIKTLNDRLDGPIREVGFHYVGRVNAKNGLSFQEQQIERAIRRNNDEFIVNLTVSHDDASIEYSGSFFVRTFRGTTYWLNTREGSDFYLDLRTFNNFNIVEYNPGMCY